VEENTAVTLFCSASGDPAPDVFWRREGRPIPSNHRRYMVLTVEQTGVSALHIEPTRSNKDDGVFECVAENGVGEPATANAELVVYPEGQGERTCSFLFQSSPKCV